MGACRTDIFQAAAEVFFIGEDGKCGGSGRFVSGRMVSACASSFIHPLEGVATLELGDDAVRRRGKTGTHTDTWHGFVTIVYQHFFADGSLLQFDLDLLAGDDFC